MAMTADDVLKLAKDKEVKFVDFRFTDTRGKEQHVQVPIKHFTKDKFESGHAFDGSSIAGWKGIQASDMLLMPDPSSARMDPFADEAVLNISCDVYEPTDGKPYDRCPRGIARRAVMDRLRRRYAEPESVAVEEADVADLHAGTDPGEDLALMHEELARMPLVEREVLVLFYLEELSLGQLAEVLSIPVGTVKSRLFRARRMLRTRLDDQKVGR